MRVRAGSDHALTVRTSHLLHAHDACMLLRCLNRTLTLSSQVELFIKLVTDQSGALRAR